MKISSSIGRVFYLIFISLTIVSSSPSHGEVEEEMEFNYEKKGERGPEKWGTLKPEWAMCGKGEMQSPIDLTSKRVLIDHNLGSLRSYYLPSNATIKNRGHDIMLKFEGGNSGLGIIINGTEYQLQQIHWHSPSEHTINGKRFILEEHMVHESKDGRNAVVAFFYKLGRPDSLLFSLERQLKKITDTYESEEHVGMIDPRRFDFESRHYYRYIGSLTTPPCSENVTWTISKEMKTVSIKQLVMLRVSVHDKLVYADLPASFEASSTDTSPPTPLLLHSPFAPYPDHPNPNDLLWMSTPTLMADPQSFSLLPPSSTLTRHHFDRTRLGCGYVGRTFAECIDKNEFSNSAIRFCLLSSVLILGENKVERDHQQEGEM